MEVYYVHRRDRVWEEWQRSVSRRTEEDYENRENSRCSTNVRSNIIQPRYHCAKLLIGKMNMYYGCNPHNCNSHSSCVSFPAYQLLILLNLSSDGGRTNETTARVCTFARSPCGPISDGERKLRDSRNYRHAETQLQPNS